MNVIDERQHTIVDRAEQLLEVVRADVDIVVDTHEPFELVQVVIEDVLHHEKGLLLRWIGIGDRRQTDEIDERIVRCRAFAGEEDHLAGHAAGPCAHDRGRTRGQEVFARHHGDENQLLLL